MSAAVECDNEPLTLADRTHQGQWRYERVVALDMDDVPIPIRQGGANSGRKVPVAGLGPCLYADDSHPVANLFRGKRLGRIRGQYRDPVSARGQPGADFVDVRFDATREGEIARADHGDTQRPAPDLMIGMLAGGECFRRRHRVKRSHDITLAPIALIARGGSS